MCGRCQMMWQQVIYIFMISLPSFCKNLIRHTPTSKLPNIMSINKKSGEQIQRWVTAHADNLKKKKIDLDWNLQEKDLAIFLFVILVCNLQKILAVMKSFIAPEKNIPGHRPLTSGCIPWCWWWWQQALSQAWSREHECAVHECDHS